MGLEPGTDLGPYKLVEQVGSGGMGQVYRALDTRLDRTVAVKVCSDAFSERFERESRVVAQLNHPNICTLHDVGPNYLVMEFIDGKPLRGPLPPEKVVRYALQICDALDAAHSRGIIHRDLKPENILLAKSGIKLLDFGLARLEPSGLANAETVTNALTAEGMIAGTLYYMSPEQLQGLPVDARSDIFSLGALLYELLSGKRAFDGDSAASIITAIMSAQPRPLGEVEPLTPPALSRAILRALEKDPDKRWQSVRDFRFALEEVLQASAEIPAAAKPERRRPWRAAFGLAGLILAAGTFFLGRWTDKPLPPLISTPLILSGGLVRDPSFAPEGKSIVFSWKTARANSYDLFLKLVGSEDSLHLTSSTNDDLSPVFSPDGTRIAFVRRTSEQKFDLLTISPLGGNEVKITEVETQQRGAPPVNLAWTPDGKFIVVTDKVSAGSHTEFGLVLISAETGKRRTLTHPDEAEIRNGAVGDAWPSFSPNGENLAFVRITGIMISRLMVVRLGKDYSPAGDAKAIETGQQNVVSPNWSEDGKDLIFAGGVGTQLEMFRVRAGGGAPPVPILPSVRVESSVVARAGHRLAYVLTQRTVNLYELPLTGPEKGREPVPLTSSPFEDFYPRFSPDGKWIALTSTRTGAPEIWLASPDGSRSMSITKPPGAKLGNEWSADSNTLYFSGTSGSQNDIFSLARDTRQVRRLTDDPANDVFPTASRDGKWIYFTSGRGGKYQLYKMPSDGGAAQVVIPRPVALARESPDGKWLYYLDYEGGTSLYRSPLGGGEEKKILDEVSQSVYDIAPEGIFYERGQELHRFDPETGKDVTLYVSGRPFYPGLSVSAGCESMVFSLVDRMAQELMLVSDFR